MKFSRLVVHAIAASVVAAGLTTISVAPAHAATHSILITGDSITQGSSGDYTWRYRLWSKLADTESDPVSFVGTRSDLYDNVNDAFGSQYYAANFGGKSHSAVWGGTFVFENDKVSAQVEATNPNVLVTLLGSNDLAFWTSPADTVANFKTYVQRARAAKPGIDIVVGEVVSRWDPWTQQVTLKSESDSYAALLKSAAAELNTTGERVIVAPTRSGWNPQIHTWDGTHPNPTGEALIAQRMSQGLAQLGVGSSSPSIAGTKAWDITGPGVSLTAGSEQADLRWNRAPSGATGMFIETRLATINEPWHRLPYAVGGDGWTAGLLAAGGNYQFRIVPAKGYSTGLAGPASSVVPTGPMPAKLGTISVIPRTNAQTGEKLADTNWSDSENATGYMLSSRLRTDPSRTDPWIDLPYPVAESEWTFGLHRSGRYYQYRAKPIRGFISPGWRNSSSKRMKGIPDGRLYAALGDSYSSGLGVYADPDDYTSGTCYRSRNDSWPMRMQNLFQLDTFLAACAGSTMVDVRGTQLSAISSMNTVNPAAPKLITMTIGGNDVGFGAVMKECFSLAGSCTGREASVANKIASLDLESMYTDLRNRAPYADILVGGYPTPADVDGRWGSSDACGLLLRDERLMAQRLTSKLNSRIYSEALAANVWSVEFDLMNSFEGHGGCGNSEWIRGAIPTFKDLSFHPNDNGQLRYAIEFDLELKKRAGGF